MQTYRKWALGVANDINIKRGILSISPEKEEGLFQANRILDAILLMFVTSATTAVHFWLESIKGKKQ
jgi:hypothetical protein